MAASSRSTWMSAWEKDLAPSAAARRSAARVDARVSAQTYYFREATARLPQERPEVEHRPLPELKVVTVRYPRWRAALLCLVFACVFTGAAVVAPMLISSTGTRVESALGELDARQRELRKTASALCAQISALSSPERISEQAEQLGLRPADSVHHLTPGEESLTSEGDTTVAGR